MIQIGGKTIEAPGFTPASFDRAVQRAHADGLTIIPTKQVGTVAISSGTSPNTYYLTTRRSCTCAAGTHGRACKHRGYALFLYDICELDITQPGMPARETSITANAS